MSVLTSVEKNFNYLYTKQSELEKLLGKVNLDLQEQCQKEKLKKELCNILSDILSLQCNDILSTSFYMQVNSIEQSIYNLLNAKKKKLKLLTNKKSNIYITANKILPIIYSIDILQNSTHIKVDIEKRLLDLKNTILNYETNKKQLIAIEYLEKKVKSYEIGLLNIIKLVSNYELKNELSFEIKQEIFNIFSEISLEIQNDINHTKVFNEDIISNELTYVEDYILWYENLFLDMFKDTGLILPSYYNQLMDIKNNKKLPINYIENFINFIYRNYISEISLYKKKLINLINKYKKEIDLQLGYCYSYDGINDINDILNKIQKEKILPSYVLTSHSKDTLKYLLFDLDISFNGGIELYNILDDLHKSICKVFNTEKYLDMYKFNTRYKSIQIAQYRQYYIDVLEEAKEQVLSEYVRKIDELIDNENLEDCSTTQIMNEINNLNDDISKLENALEYINKNYRSFNNENFKTYINTIQKRYEISELYNNIINKKSKLFYKLKAKMKFEEESKFIYEFANKKWIKEQLNYELLQNIFKDDTKLLSEITENVKND